ncbi:MAG: sulfite reductase, dissimilatory-type subunit alpha, partial [Rhodospirillaceae bacterium]|nr:sulfite reductase, dissimilatory-type subunit alpha [Rhodospirillaceae bacterium]
NFLDGVGVEIDPNMVNHPRTNSYVDTADWDQEADKWLERKAGEAAE